MIFVADAIYTELICYVNLVKKHNICHTCRDSDSVYDFGFLFWDLWLHYAGFCDRFDLTMSLDSTQLDDNFSS